MVDIDLVRRKLSRLNMYLDKLEPITKHTFDEYLADYYLKSTAELLIQLIMDIDDDKIYKTLPLALSDYKEYINQVDEYLDKQ